LPINPPSPSTPATPAARAKADASRPPGRRRIPLWVFGLSGALLAAAYGRFGLGMRVGPPLVMTGLGGLALVLAAYALWRVVDPLTRDEVRATAEQRAPHRIRELEREKQAVLKAIKEIELDHQMRKIGDADYREMVERYRARALRVMGELADGDDYRALIERELKDRLAAIRAGAAAPVKTAAVPSSAPAAAGTSGVCAACATANDSDARFCKRCGAALAAGDAPPAGGLLQ
jgi:hypothetical protein